MSADLTYSEAFEKLKMLVAELEEGDIQLDKLPEKVKEANELIAICETKLRGIDQQVKEAANAPVAPTKNKNDS